MRRGDGHFRPVTLDQIAQLRLARQAVDETRTFAFGWEGHATDGQNAVPRLQPDLIGHGLDTIDREVGGRLPQPEHKPSKDNGRKDEVEYRPRRDSQSSRPKRRTRHGVTRFVGG